MSMNKLNLSSIIDDKSRLAHLYKPTIIECDAAINKYFDFSELKPTIYDRPIWIDCSTAKDKVVYLSDADDVCEYMKSESNRRDLTMSLFLRPLLIKLFKIVEAESKIHDYYSIFKSKFFEPILNAEYARMCHDNLNYLDEKPLIICSESAISRMLNEDTFVKSVQLNICKKFYKELNKYSIKLLKVSDYEGAEQIGEYEFKKHFDFKHKKFNEIVGYSLNSIGETVKFGLFDTSSEEVFDDFEKTIKFFTKIFFVRYIQQSINGDVADSSRFPEEDNVISNIVNELTIFNIRTAKIFVDYKSNFNESYDNDVRVSFIEDVRDYVMKPKFDNMIDDIEFSLKNFGNSIVTTDDDKYITDSMASLYSFIGKVESFNKDYTTGSIMPITGVDAEQLHTIFENMILSYKKLINVYRICVHNIMGKPFNSYLSNDDCYKFAKELISGIVNWTIRTTNAYSNNSKIILPIIDKEIFIKILELYVTNKNFSAYFRDKQNIDVSVSDEFYKNMCGCVKKIMEIIIDFEKDLNEYRKIIDDWRKMLTKNIEYFASSANAPGFETINQFLSDKCICSIENSVIKQ